MECYDARIIEGCCVYSYTVEGPSRTVSGKEAVVPAAKKKAPRKRAARVNVWKKMMFGILFLLLVPFAVVIDSLCFALKKTAEIVLSLFSVRPIRKTASVLGALTCVSLLSAILLVL